MREHWSGVLACVAISLSMAATACSDSSPIVPRHAPPPAKTINGSADDDKTMGNLSAIARHVAAALEDPQLRGAVVRAMKDSVNNPIGVDLAECSGGSIGEKVLRAGELRGGEDASTLCDRLRAGNGAMLFMDRTRLAGWDSTTIPVVTAIADPAAPRAKSFHGYRSPELVMNVPADGSLAGPVLVVLPYTNPRRAVIHSAQPLPSVAVYSPRQISPRTRTGVAP